MPITEQQLVKLQELVQEIWGGPPGDSVRGLSAKSIESLKVLLQKLNHHDEYYVILDLAKFELIWAWGLEKALEYKSEDWKFTDNLGIVHESYWDLFITFGKCAYDIFKIEGNLHGEQRALAERYIINIPVRKNNGTYVWVKQMSMPLSADENNVMRLQLNTYTIISPFDDVFLPLGPRLFYSSGERAKDLEKHLYAKFLEMLKIKITPNQERIMKSYQGVYEEQKKLNPNFSYSLITHAMIVTHIGNALTLGSVKKESSDIITEFKEKTKVKFPNIVQLAKFMRPYYSKT